MFKVLVVEDNDILQFLLGKQLSKVADCDVVRDGYQALELFKCALDGQRPYGAVIMDLHLPGISGLETSRAIRRLEAGHVFRPDPVWVVVLTSNNWMKTAVLSDPVAKVNVFLQKPHSADDLVKALGRSVINI